MDWKEKIIEGMKLLKEGCKENRTLCVGCPMSFYCDALFAEKTECPADFYIPK